MKKFTNEIFEGTLLEGIPFNYRYVNKRPKHIYEYKNNKITLHSFPEWRKFPKIQNATELTKRIRKLFLHDTCHALVFYFRNQNKRIFMNDLGMNWDHVSVIDDDNQKFHVHSHLIDEYKVSALYYILLKSFHGERVFSRQQAVERISTHEAWHTANIYDGDDFDAKAVAKKNNYIRMAVDYWYDMGLDKVRKQVKEFVKYLQTQNLKTEY